MNLIGCFINHLKLSECQSSSEFPCRLTHGIKCARSITISQVPEVSERLSKLELQLCAWQLCSAMWQGVALWDPCGKMMGWNPNSWTCCPRHSQGTRICYSRLDTTTSNIEYFPQLSSIMAVNGSDFYLSSSFWFSQRQRLLSPVSASSGPY